jgi:hypothetical protein
MNQQPAATLTIHQNKYLSADDDEMHAVVTVTAHELSGALWGQAPEAAEVIAIDCSGSMGYPMEKIVVARRATKQAIDALRDGVHFAVLAGTETATMVYPADRRLAVATTETKLAAKRAVEYLDASGGTAMGTWLRLADELLRRHPTAVRHVILLTDGQDLPQNRRTLDDALTECQGNFVCDGRGIGDDYAPAELQRIVSTLLGSADAIVEDADLVTEFAEMMRTAMSKVVPDLHLRIRTMPYTRLRSVKQGFPNKIDLSGLGTPIDERTTTFSTGSWRDGEEREFCICVEVDTAGRDMREDLQAAVVDMAIVRAGGTEPERCGSPEAIQVHLTDEPKLSGVVHPKVAHHAGEAELSQLVNDGCEAHDRGDPGLAEERWGRATVLAAQLGHDKMLKRLGRLVDIIGDPANGKVRIKEGLRPRDIFSAFMGSLTASRSPDKSEWETHNPEWNAMVERPDQQCPNCDNPAPSTATFCGNCGHRLAERA